MFKRQQKNNLNRNIFYKIITVHGRAGYAFIAGFLLALFLNLLLFAGCSGSSIEIEKVQEALKRNEPQVQQAIICKNVDSDFSALEPTDIFPPGTKSIYLSIKFRYFTPSDEIKVIWEYMEAQKQISIQEFSPEIVASGYHSFNIKTPDSFPPGIYRAGIYLNENQVDVIEFTVE